MKPLRRFTVRPTLPESLAPLRTLVNNLRWTWHRPTRDLFASIDPALWEAVAHNPVRLLSEVPAHRVEELAADRAFLDRLGAAEADLKEYLAAPGWYQSLTDAPSAIAYFSPEFGLSEVLPQYSGGLGVLAGDHLKSASDLNLPLVAVGLFYRLGYFAQSMSSDGRQQEHYPYFNPDEMPLELVVDEAGTEKRISIQLPDGPLQARIWKAQVGRISLLLLDSQIEDNTPEAQQLTDRLYGGGAENRLRQEILLGIGGVKALAAVGVEPEVFHTNEGHAGFLGLERIRRLIEEDGLDVPTAIETVRGGTVFTTHTPVAAGIDRFARHLIEQYFGPGGVPTGMSVEELMELGADQGDGGVFNMAVMGLRLAQRANGVSALHGQVSREIFSWLWPGFDTPEVPIGHITNGVHAGTWIHQEWQDLFTRELGEDYDTSGRSWEPIRNVSDQEIWDLRARARHRLVDDARSRLKASWRERGVSEGQLGWIGRAFDPDVLTIGFARRVPSYKRLTLILRDRDRLKKLLLDPERPIQLLIAGKAHPADEGGKALIHEFAQFASDPEVRHRIAFLPDYDMALGRSLTSGADVWLNNPLRPYEACGTSGMKAALNGCLNLSIRDGWWDELYDGRNGWAIPSVDDGSVDVEHRDDFESQAIFDLLEQNVVPLFYDRSAGLPYGWISMIKHDLESLGPEVLASRMVRDYTEKLYVPASHASRALRGGKFAAAKQHVAWKERIAKSWPEVHVEHVDAEHEDYHLGARLPIKAVVALGALTPDDVRVQAAFGRVGIDDDLPEPQLVPLTPSGSSRNGAWTFTGELPLTNSGAFGYTVRVVPYLDDDTRPSELGLVTWAS
jgi:starch phosphorylase